MSEFCANDGKVYFLSRFALKSELKFKNVENSAIFGKIGWNKATKGYFGGQVFNNANFRNVENMFCKLPKIVTRSYFCSLLTFDKGAQNMNKLLPCQRWILKTGCKNYEDINL